MKYLSLMLLVVLITACDQHKVGISNNTLQISPVAAENTKTVIEDTSPNSLSAKTTEIKPLINFYSLARKTISEIEKIYGKPSEIDTKSVQFKTGEFRIYDKNGKRFLQVDYLDGKAVAFYLEIPIEFQTESPEETIKLCGLNLKLSEAEIEKRGESLWWDKRAAAKPFFTIKIDRYGDSRLFYSCEAHVKL